MAINLTNLVKLLESEFESGKTRQAGREKEGIAALKKAIAQFGPGYGVGMEAKALAGAKTALPRGISGATSRPGAVSAGMSAEFEDMRRGKLSGALSNLGSFLGSYRDPYAVSAGDLTHAATGGFGGLLNERMAVEQANTQVRERSAANRTAGQDFLSNWSDSIFGGGGSGGGGTAGGGGIGGYNAFDAATSFGDNRGPEGAMSEQALSSLKNLNQTPEPPRYEGNYKAFAAKQMEYLKATGQL